MDSLGHEPTIRSFPSKRPGQPVKLESNHRRNDTRADHGHGQYDPWAIIQTSMLISPAASLVFGECYLQGSREFWTGARLPNDQWSNQLNHSIQVHISTANYDSDNVLSVQCIYIYIDCLHFHFWSSQQLHIQGLILQGLQYGSLESDDIEKKNTFQNTKGRHRRNHTKDLLESCHLQPWPL